MEKWQFRKHVLEAKLDSFHSLQGNIFLESRKQGCSVSENNAKEIYRHLVLLSPSIDSIMSFSLKSRKNITRFSFLISLLELFKYVIMCRKIHNEEELNWLLFLTLKMKSLFPLEVYCFF